MPRHAFDLGAVLASPILLGTFVVAVPGWFTAFIAQIVIESKFRGASRSGVGFGWFSIFVELFLIAGVLWTLSTLSVAEHRLQVAVWLAIAVVFAVIECDASIYGEFTATPSASRAMGAGYLLLAFVNIVWLLFFAASEDTYVFNLVGAHFARGSSPNGIAPRRSIIGRPLSRRSFGSEAHMNGVGGPTYSPPLDQKDGGSNPSVDQSHHTGIGLMMTQNTTTSLSQIAATKPAPLGGSPQGDVQAQAKALYTYKRNEDDPNEISFDKGETLQVLDRSGKWWQVRRQNGEHGIAPSNYLQLVEA